MDGSTDNNTSTSQTRPGGKKVKKKISTLRRGFGQLKEAVAQKRAGKHEASQQSTPSLLDGNSQLPTRVSTEDYGIDAGAGEEPQRVLAENRFASFIFVTGVGDKFELLHERDRDTISDPLKRPYKGTVLQQFPKDTKYESIPPQVWMFCMPSAIRLETKKLADKCFPFILTDAMGVRLYGYCYTFYERVPAEKIAQLELGEEADKVYFAPKCVCILSHHQFWEALRVFVLDLMQLVKQRGGWRPIDSVDKVTDSDLALSVALERDVIRFLMETPLPPKSLSFGVGLSFLNAMLKEEEHGSSDPSLSVVVSKPSKQQLPVCAFPAEYLFQCLSVDNVIQVVRCILLECRVLFISENISITSIACEIILRLLHPFEWPHVYVPVLPQQLVDFVYSPTPFVMGIQRQYLTRARADIENDVVIVDLDHNQIYGLESEAVPEKSEIPPKLFERLQEDLSNVFGTFRHQLDQPQSFLFKPSPRQHVGRLPVDQVNFAVQCSFARFFTALLHSYKRNLVYIRVAPDPIAIFDKAGSLTFEFKKDLGVSHKSARFVEYLLDTQAFSSFLETHCKPFPNVFDRWVEDFEEINKRNIFELMEYETSKHKPRSLNNTASFHVWKHTMCEMEPADFTRIHDDGKHTIEFPVWNAEFLAVGEGMKPDEVSFELQSEDHLKYAEASMAPPAEEEENEDSVRYKVQKLLKYAVVNNSDSTESSADLTDNSSMPVLEFAISSAEITEIVDCFRYKTGRRAFGEELWDYAKGSHKRINEGAFVKLLDLINACVREACANSDYDCARLIAKSVFNFYKMNQGAEVFMYQQCRHHEMWASQAFWEKSALVEMSERISELYGNDIRLFLLNQFRQGQADSSEEPSTVSEQINAPNLVAKEQDAVFELLSSFGFKMINFNVDPDLIRRFMSKMTQFMSLSDEHSKVLMQLLSNMMRINERILDELTDTDSNTPDLKHKMKLEGYVPVGHHSGAGGAQTSFQKFIEGHDEDGRLKISAHPRGNGFVKGAPTSPWMKSQNSLNFQRPTQSEFRDDYLVKTFMGHSEGVLDCVIANKFVASSSGDGSIKMWNPLSTECTATLTGHDGWVNLLENDLEESKLYSGSYDKTVKMWDIQKQSKMHSLRGHKGSISILKRAGKNEIITGSYDHSLMLWDTRTRHHKKPVITFNGHSGPVICFDFGENSNQFFSGSRDTTIMSWDIRKPQALSILQGHKDWVKCITFDPGSGRVFSGGCDSTARIWNLKTFQSVELEGHTGAVNSLALSSDGARLVTASSDSDLKVWNVKKGACELTLNNHTDEVSDVLWFHDTIASCSYDSTVRVWDGKSGFLLRVLYGHNLRCTSLKALDNKLASTSWDHTLKVWEFTQDFRLKAD